MSSNFIDFYLNRDNEDKVNNTQDNKQEDKKVEKKQIKIDFEEKKEVPVQEQPIKKDLQTNNEINKNQTQTKQILSQDNPLDDSIIEKLFNKSETPISMKEKWINLYKNAWTTKKKGYVVEKCKKGLFTFNKDGNLELLSNYDVHGKSTKEILDNLCGVK